MSKKKQKIFKYNQDDILEILTENLAEEGGFDTFQSKAILLGTPGKDLRLITVISEIDDDTIIDIDLDEIDKSMNFNASHSELNARFHLNRNDKK